MFQLSPYKQDIAYRPRFDCCAAVLLLTQILLGRDALLLVVGAFTCPSRARRTLKVRTVFFETSGHVQRSSVTSRSI
jgi:hypothetical protein